MAIDETFIAKRITQLRMQKNISARDMSLSLGQSESYINKIENGRTLPSMSVFFYICDYFRITPREFFLDDIEAPTLLKELYEELKDYPPEKINALLAFLRAIG